jgi:Uma2 family endonuclease
MTTTTKKLTFEAFIKRPERKPYREYDCGEVFRKGMGTDLHTFVEAMLSILIVQFVMRRNLGVAGPELRCNFGPPDARRSYVPDFAFVSGERWPEADRWQNRPFEGAPDFVVEVLSPDDRPSRVSRKIDTYLRFGVRIVWLVNPKNRTVTVHRPDSEIVVLQLGDVLDGGDVIPGLRFPVDDLFPTPAPHPSA